MPNCVNPRGARTCLALAIALVVSAPAFAQTARERFQSASEREAQLRVVLTNTTAPAPASDVRSQVSKVITSFESLVRRFPTSGYADNAL